jgi:hypothetical protein
MHNVLTTYVTIRGSVYEQALDWVKENCPNYITNDMHMDGYNTYDPKFFDFFFSVDAQEEMTVFALRWA